MLRRFEIAGFSAGHSDCWSMSPTRYQHSSRYRTRRQLIPRQLGVKEFYAFGEFNIDMLEPSAMNHTLLQGLHGMCIT